RYRINISGTGIREMLRHGILPPKEIVRPESARIAIQGIQPKGVDANNESVGPVGNTIKSIFPFYVQATRLGGPKRAKPLNVDELTIKDLEAAVLDTRSNADRIYKDIFDEFSYLGDTNRNMQPDWVAEARESARDQQEMVIDYMKEKVKQAPETASDEFMYQDKAEAERELDVARQILEEMPQATRPEHHTYKTWNTLPYKRYRGSDED